MQIKNSTKFDDADLRRLFRRCITEVELVEQPRYRFYRIHNHYTLEVKNSSYYGISGRAVNGKGGLGLWMMIKIPTKWQEEGMNLEKKKMLARLIIHEYYHNLGFSYWDRNGYKCDSSKKWNVDWVEGYSIGYRVEKPKITTGERQQERYMKARENLKRAETRLKRAKTLFGKWQDRVKYYEVVFAKRNTE